MVQNKTFYRGKDGKISNKRVSPYGKNQLRMLQGAKLHFNDDVLTVKDNKLINKNNKVVLLLNNDRDINKVIYKIM